MLLELLLQYYINTFESYKRVACASKKLLYARKCGSSEGQLYNYGQLYVSIKIFILFLDNLKKKIKFIYFENQINIFEIYHTMFTAKKN